MLTCADLNPWNGSILDTPTASIKDSESPVNSVLHLIDDDATGVAWFPPGVDAAFEYATTEDALRERMAKICFAIPPAM